MKNKSLRWELAQKYEYNWWKKREDVVYEDYYKKSADEIKTYYCENNELTEDTRILEIGSGACGILTFLTESQERYAIDPLETFYSTVHAFAEMRDQSVRYYAAKGESVPFENDMFDLVIVDNVLDHCENPIKVIAEIKRVLKPAGSIYFRQNTYSFYGKFLRLIMELFLIDRGHPYTFLKRDIKSLFNQFGFKIIGSENAGYFQTWRSELMSRSLKDKFKALLFVTRDKVTYFMVNAE